jgi:adenylosuccinate lyase
MLALIDAGLTREEAYKLVQDVAMRAMESGKGFLEMVKNDPQVGAYLTTEQISRRCALEHHLRNENNTLNRLGLTHEG